MSYDDDRDLREPFAAMRRHEAEDAPPYAEIRLRRVDVRAASARGHLRWWAPAIAAAAAAVVAWLAIPSTPPPGLQPVQPVQPGWPSGQWAMPTDVLLDLSGLPGGDLLRELPAIGAIDSGRADGDRTDSTRVDDGAIDDTKRRYEV